jgi:hypothetical protein
MCRCTLAWIEEDFERRIEMTPFMFAIICRGVDGKASEDKIISQGCVLAKNENSARIRLASELTPQWQAKIGQIEMLVKPF